MYKPTIYFYILFIFVLIKLMKQGYYKNVFGKMYNELSRKYVYTISVVLITVLTILFWDKPLNKFITSLSYPFLKHISKFANEFGKGEVHFSILLLIVVVLFFLDKRKSSILFSISLMSSILAGIFVNILKMLFTRARPFVDLNPYNIFAFSEALLKGKLFKFPYMSLPSGHTITVFAAITPLFLYVKNKYLKTFFVLLGLIIAFGRVYDSVHWPSDVFLGAVLGIFIGKIVYDNNLKRLSLNTN